MKQKMKRLISFMLVLSMLLSMVSTFPAYADTFDEQTTEAMEEAYSSTPVKAGDWQKSDLCGWSGLELFP